MKPLYYLILTLLLACRASGPKNDVAPNENVATGYTIQDVLITTRDGAKISGIVVRDPATTDPRPVILQSTIYVRDQGRDLQTLKTSVDQGYVGMIVYSRGKRHSTEAIWPYEHDGKDTYDVIDWVSKQEWCDGRVGMFGGSYNGFTQWAATKTLHPALKTIVPYVANRPGMGLPMENNVFINANYEWAFYVGNNRHLDTIAGADRQRSRDLQFKWWDSGRAYRTLDSLDQRPNKWFQRWIAHPSFDTYWQEMAPYKSDFAQIDIPVLSIDGYYNDSQNSGLYYLREHYKYNPKAEHYLIIGPYGHYGAQRGGFPEVNGYTVDADALIDTEAITYAWFDHIFNNAEKPDILKDRINYQVMGANEWRSAPSLDQMCNETLKFYLTKENVEDIYRLGVQKPREREFHVQEVDFSNREIWNNDYYPNPIIRDYRDMRNGFNFISDPLEESIIVNGSFLGELQVEINKKDFDFGVTLYELLPDDTYFCLSYIVGRASFAKDISNRELLRPNILETLPFSNTHLVSKKIDKGNRLMVYINVNKNPFSELNYGTGKPVSEETIQDANDPLRVKWSTDSFVEIPIWRGGRVPE